MAGIYIHIPFCNKKCFYCDFYSIANLSDKNEFVKSLLKEIELQKNYLKNSKIETLYIGGGTPSLLDITDINKILEKLNYNFDLSKIKEFTIEVNPEDLTTTYLNQLKKSGVNRLSIGIQSFFDDDLKLMNRNHNIEDAKKSIINAQNTGFTNINIDLIYGLPNSTITKWKTNIITALKFDTPHISAYHLTYEPNTVFYKYLQKKRISQVNENQSIEQYNLLLELTKKYGFEHYEISNFAKNKLYSLHNTNYWKNKKYLGLGPSAHSYNKISRQWNFSNIKSYINNINNNIKHYETETLSENDKFNDLIITNLRTSWGININEVKENFDKKYYTHLTKKINKYINTDRIIFENNILRLTDNGLIISDSIFEDFII